MLHSNKKDIIGVYYNKHTIVKIYKNAVLLWEIAGSCFSRGYWINTLGWSNTEGWKNNNI